MTVANVEHRLGTQIFEPPPRVIRPKGYRSTRIEDSCEVSALTKGFLRPRVTADFFNAASFPAHPSIDRVRACVDFGKASCAASRLNSPVPLVQWRRRSLRAIRSRARLAIRASAAIGEVEADKAQGIAKYGIGADWSARSLAFYAQAVMQARVYYR
jgi:hypothetical protein